MANCPDQSLKSVRTMPYDDYNRWKTIVFWDIDDCRIPLGLDAIDVSENIKAGLKKKGYHGSVKIYPFGHTDHMLDDFDGFSCFNIDTADERRKMILADFLCRAFDNKWKPTNLMLIMGDISTNMGFLMAIHSLKSQGNYNFLLAHPREVSGLLHHAVSTKWIWRSLAMNQG